MQLTLLLYALGLVLRVAARCHPAFRRYIANTRARILIKTADGTRARLFVFDKGRFRSFPGGQGDFDAAMVWQDAATGFAVMTSRRPDAAFNAAAAGKLRVEGTSLYAQWFEDGLKLLV
ncbi:MAG TPA: hypothetical protein ENF48_00375 [Desulfobacteraceae bacterium]|nr:hypothetical protein [Deltaproteobacteria bacterium]HDI58806.1 hypothetical protein [Desulfobacteraceae bacterium]